MTPREFINYFIEISEKDPNILDNITGFFLNESRNYCEKDSKTLVYYGVNYSPQKHQIEIYCCTEEALGFVQSKKCKIMYKIHEIIEKLFRKKQKKQQHTWPEFDEDKWRSLFNQEGNDVIKENLYLNKDD